MERIDRLRRALDHAKLAKRNLDSGLWVLQRAQDPESDLFEVAKAPADRVIEILFEEIECMEREKELEAEARARGRGGVTKGAVRRF